MRSARIPILLLSLASFAFGADFSGKWFLDARRSDTHALSLPTAQTLTVTQGDTAIQCEGTYPDGSSRRWSYLLDGAETEGSIVKWEGAAMLVNTQVSGAREYTVMDRWELSGNAASLTITRQVVLKEGQAGGFAGLHECGRRD